MDDLFVKTTFSNYKSPKEKNDIKLDDK